MELAWVDAWTILRPASAAAPAPPTVRDTAGDKLTLHANLLGDFQVAGSADRRDELETLTARAAIYAKIAGWHSVTLVVLKSLDDNSASLLNTAGLNQRQKGARQGS